MSDSVWTQRRQPTLLPCPRDSPGKNTEVGCHFLLHTSLIWRQIANWERVWRYYCIESPNWYALMHYLLMRIPDHFTCLLKNLYAGQEATVRTGHGTIEWFQIRRGVPQSSYCHPVYLTYMESTSCKMLGWMKHKLESRLPREISITSECRWHHPYGRKWRGTKKPLDES